MSGYSGGLPPDVCVNNKCQDKEELGQRMTQAASVENSPVLLRKMYWYSENV